MIHDAGSFLWLWSNQSQKDHGEDTATSKDSGKAIQASGDSARETKVSGDSGKEVVASRDSSQEMTTKITNSKTKTRSGVLIKNSSHNLKQRCIWQKQNYVQQHGTEHYFLYKVKSTLYLLSDHFSQSSSFREIKLHLNYFI